MVGKFFILLRIFQIHLFTFFVTCENVNVTEEAHSPQLIAREIFNKTNTYIHKALNEVFGLLQLPPITIENETLHDLLEDYTELKKVNEVSHKIYQDIEIMTRVNKTIDNSPVNFVVDINELTMEVLLDYLKKRMPRRLLLQEAMISKVEDEIPEVAITTANADNQHWKMIQSTGPPKSIMTLYSAGLLRLYNYAPEWNRSSSNSHSYENSQKKHQKYIS